MVLQNLINNALRPSARSHEIGDWQVPDGSAEDLAFALKCVRNAAPQDHGAIVAGLVQIGRDATWLSHDDLADLSVKTGSPISFLSASIDRVNAWLASVDRYMGRFGVPCGTAGYQGDGVLYQGGIPTAMILAGDSTSLTAWALGHALLSGSPLIVKPSNVEPLSAFRFAEAVRRQGLRAPNLLFLDSSRDAERAMIQRAMMHCGQSVIYGEDDTVKAVYGAVTLPPSHRAIPYWSGRSGAIVFPDADLDLAARCIITGASVDRGNMCNSTKKVFVPVALKAEFERRLCQEAGALRRGDPLDPATEIGRADPVGRHMAERNSSGARVFYDQDIVLAEATDGSPLLLEETPYPILGIRYYGPLEDPVGLANETVHDTPSGRALVMAVFTAGDEAVRRATQLRAYKVLKNQATSTVDHFAPHQGMHLAIELMRPMAFPG